MLVRALARLTDSSAFWAADNQAGAVHFVPFQRAGDMLFGRPPWKDSYPQGSAKARVGFNRRVFKKRAENTRSQVSVSTE
jgi:hypothetical protein